MGNYYFITEFPTDTSSRYSHRIPQSTWNQYKSVVQHLHDTGLTRRQILAELAKHDFNPSFGQLVAQMTRWRMVRYSTQSDSPPQVASPQRSPPSSSPKTSQTRHSVVNATGIIRLVSVLQDAGQQQPTPEPYVTSHRLAPTPTLELTKHDDLTDIMTMLSLSGTSSRDSQVLNHENCDDYKEVFETASMLFLGEAYCEAFDAYFGIIVRFTKPTMTIEEEQIKVQALIGCLKSAATEDQHNKAINLAQTCMDALLLTTSALPDQCFSTTSRTALGEVFDKWYDRDCALAKVTFDLLTTYKRSRTWSNPQQVRWAHNVTAHEWMCSRLVRLPTWEAAVPWTDTANTQLTSSQVFDPCNIQSLLTWATSAVKNFSLLYDEQLPRLLAWPSLAAGLHRILLFWRLDFFSKHSQSQCPPLQIRLTTDTTFTASTSQTTSVLAHILIPLDSNSTRSFSSTMHTSATLLSQLQKLRDIDGHEAHSSRFWNALREVLVPSFRERFSSVL